jgi:hypothetical protein
MKRTKLLLWIGVIIFAAYCIFAVWYANTQHLSLQMRVILFLSALGVAWIIEHILAHFGVI